MALLRLPFRLKPDPARVVVRPFNIAVEPRDLNPTNLPRAQRIVDRVARMPEAAIADEYEKMLVLFRHRHRSLERVLDSRLTQLQALAGNVAGLSLNAQRFIAAHFCHEYSFESSALFNPSIVAHYDQRGEGDGSVRFILSLRSVGEGHISSINFRTGVWAADGSVAMEEALDLAQVAEPAVGATYDDRGALTIVRPPDIPLNELVIFPMTAAQRNGVEDLRLTAFTEDSGEITYFGTYTAYSGMAIGSELLETKDFRTFRMQKLSGPAAVNKGLALFPRRIKGDYAMLTRIDNEHIYLSRSRDVAHWERSERVIGPKYPWEFVQMGNCGAPIETDAGWLVLTHGVGAMRQYALGAFLLDLENPSRLIARTPEPIMKPSDDERKGYVPNVLYTCGMLKLGERILIPYGISDVMTGFATTTVDELMALMAPADQGKSRSFLTRRSASRRSLR